MRMLIFLPALLLIAGGCRWGELKFDPSEHEFTTRMQEYVDGLSPGKESCEIDPLAYVAEGAASDQCADSTFWLLNYFENDEVAKLGDGYVYQSVSALCPIAVGRAAYRFDATGKKVAESRAGLFGVYLVLPPLDVASFHYRTSRDVAAGLAYRDYGLYILRLPLIETALLRLSTDGFDFLFIPFWRKDTSPRRKSA